MPWTATFGSATCKVSLVYHMGLLVNTYPVVALCVQGDDITVRSIGDYTYSLETYAVLEELSRLGSICERNGQTILQVEITLETQKQGPNL